ncbi:MAG: cyanophycin synthetase, partial [Burkholderiales bacterium]
AQGKRLVYREGSDIVAVEGGFELRIPLSEVPLTRHGTIVFQIDNAMAAVGAAWALDLDWNVIRRGLASFVSDASRTPGRFNVFDYRGATVIADYGHNADAMHALVQAVEAMPARRRSVVLSAAGDRRDEDIRTQAEILGHAFDDVILYEDACLRGRAPGETFALLREGLARARRAQNIREIRGEFAAIDEALARLEPGDLCLILVDQVEAALAHLQSRLAHAQVV